MQCLWWGKKGSVFYIRGVFFRVIRKPLRGSFCRGCHRGALHRHALVRAPSTVLSCVVAMSGFVTGGLGPEFDSSRELGLLVIGFIRRRF